MARPRRAGHIQPIPCSKRGQVSGDPGQQRLQMQQVLKALRKGIEKVQGCGKDGAGSDADIDLLIIGKELSGQT